MFLPRRNFLKQFLSASTLLPLSSSVPAFLNRTAYATDRQRDKDNTVLVVVQLAGGNDGLNTVVPYSDDHYAKNRTTLRLASQEVHKIDSELGFHPRMSAFKRLYQEGYLSIVQGVGYPNPDKDHFGGMQNWHTAKPGISNAQTGWLGRALDLASPQDTSTVPAVFAGDIALPFSLNAEKTIVPSVRSLNDYTIQAWNDSKSGQTHTKPIKNRAERTRTTNENPLLDFLRKSDSTACANSQRIKEMAQSISTAVDYPSYKFAGRLRTIAHLIRADLGIRIFYTELGGAEPGGFDSHANQRGNHGALLHQLSESVTAFVDDLVKDRSIDRVLLLTFSEFGRTVMENGRHGTGHGSAAPMLLAGGRLKGGLIGSHPSLSDLDDGGAQKHHTDFRQVYATVLDAWLGYDSRPVLGKKYDQLKILKT